MGSPFNSVSASAGSIRRAPPGVQLSSGTMCLPSAPPTHAFGTPTHSGSCFRMENVPGPVPPELMLACFVVAGFVVSICYTVDWKLF